MGRPKLETQKLTRSLRFSLEGWVKITGFCVANNIEYSDFIEKTILSVIDNKEKIVFNVETSENISKLDSTHEKKIIFRQKLKKKLFKYYHKLNSRTDEIKTVVLQDLNEELRFATVNSYLTHDLEWLKIQIKLITEDRLNELDLDKEKHAYNQFKGSLIASNMEQKDRDILHDLYSRFTR